MLLTLMILLKVMVQIHLRLYEMFMGPLDGSIAWSANGVDGSSRFLDRIWRLLIDDNGNLNPKIKENVEQESGLRESLPSNR